jgi:hypothetical protein
MPKEIFTGQQGLSKTIKNDGSKYSVGLNIDPFREYGFLRNSFLSSAVTGTLDSSVVDGVTNNSGTTYLITTGKVFSMDAGNGVATSFRDFSGAGIGDGASIVSYAVKVGGTLYDGLFYMGSTKAGLHYYSGGDQFDDDWLSTVPAGAASFNGGSGYAYHPYIIWQNFLMIGDGNSVIKFDGQNGANGTYTDNWFEVGANWYVRHFFKYQNYLGVVVKDLYNKQSEILLIDGSSSTLANKRINIKENIVSVANIGNDVIFVTSDIKSGVFIKSLGDNGLETLYEIKIENDTTTGSLLSYTQSGVYDVYDNKIAFACKDGTSWNIFVFGRKDESSPYILYKPFKATGQNISMIRWLSTGFLYVSSYTTTTYYVQTFSTGNSTATLKHTFKDFGQKVRINYVKFYFKTLASGDSLTVGVDTDYDTSNSLGTITYTTDGAVTSKRFNFVKHCHAFRPTIAWTAGGASISKIVVDYDFVDDI